MRVCCRPITVKLVSFCLALAISVLSLPDLLFTPFVISQSNIHMVKYCFDRVLLRFSSNIPPKWH